GGGLVRDERQGEVGLGELLLRVVNEADLAYRWMVHGGRVGAREEHPSGGDVLACFVECAAMHGADCEGALADSPPAGGQRLFARAVAGFEDRARRGARGAPV